MVTKKQPTAPETLMDAHLLLGQLRPKLAETNQTWLSYYRRSAAVYAEVAEIDRGHHHECLYWANREAAKAHELAAELAKNPSLASKPRSTEGGGTPPTLITGR